MRTIGVLGGMGPQATMDFERRLHRAAQRAIPASANGGYPPMVVAYLRQPPIVFDAEMKPRIPFVIQPALLETARRLGPLCDFLVLTSNFPHLFRAEIEQASGRELLSMVDLALDALGTRRWARVGVIGMGLPTVYTDRIAAMGLRHETLPPGERAALDAAILAVMEGRETDAHRAAARESVETMRARRVDGTILGCTEIPLLLGEAAEGADLLNPLELLAEAAVARAIA